MYEGWVKPVSQLKGVRRDVADLSVKFSVEGNISRIIAVHFNIGAKDICI